MREKMSEFLKNAIKKGKVRPLEEAFELYPTEEEEHKGKLESYLNEESTPYYLYNVGDIVFVNNYRYKDGREGTNHLFVIIEENNYAVPIEYLGMLISSKLEKLKYSENMLLKKDEQNRLHRDSIVKTDEIYQIKIENIMFKIGTINRETIEEYKENFNRL